MPSISYMNQSAPFWDFIASLEQQGSQHPYFARNQGNENEQEREQANEQDGQRGPTNFGPWGWGQFFGGGNDLPHRGASQQHQGDVTAEKNEEKNEIVDGEKGEKHHDNKNGEGPSQQSGSDNEGHCSGGRRHGRCAGRRGRCGPGGRGGFGGFGGPGGPGGPGGFGGPCGRGGFGFRRGPGHHGGPWGRGRFGGFDPSAIAAHFWNQFNETSANDKKGESEDHAPDADVFDTDAAFVVHLSLPGAKKEDVGVNWDAEKSELSVAGVIYRPGDEEFLKTLAMDERKIGAFERKIRLGTRANPAQIDAESIVAKLEDGVLTVEVPKLDAGYVEVRKVDIE